MSSEYRPTGCSTAYIHLPDDSGLPSRGVLVEWHEGRVSAGLDGGPFIPLPIHVNDDGGGKYCTCRGADGACRGCPDCRAYEAELELDDAKAACAALNRTCVEGQEREREMEAQCAAMREALEHFARARKEEHHGELHSEEATARGCLCRWCVVSRALAANAGREFYDRLMRLEAAADERAALRDDLNRIGAEMGLPPGVGPADGELARILGDLRSEVARREAEIDEWKATVARLGAQLRQASFVASGQSAGVAEHVVRRLGQCLAALRSIRERARAGHASLNFKPSDCVVDELGDLAEAALTKAGKP